MVATVPQRHRYSFSDYVGLESASNTKHEFLDGEIYAMAGGTPEHAILAVAVSGVLFGQLAGGPCRVASSDLRIRVLATGLATYPDVTVVCGPLELDPEAPTWVTNPTLLVEVLSEATEAYDRGEKFQHYKQIPSLREYVLVSQTAPEIEVHRRENDGSWSRRVWHQDQAELQSIGCTLPLDAVYGALPKAK